MVEVQAARTSRQVPTFLGALRETVLRVRNIDLPFRLLDARHIQGIQFGCRSRCNDYGFQKGDLEEENYFAEISV